MDFVFSSRTTGLLFLMTSCINRKSYRTLGGNRGLGSCFLRRLVFSFLRRLVASFSTRSGKPKDRTQFDLDLFMQFEWVKGLKFTAQLVFGFVADLGAGQQTLIGRGRLAVAAPHVSALASF